MTRILIKALLALSFVVILMGAYTRLADAGLGCPDWPGCYGHLFVPQGQDAIIMAEKAYPEAMPVEAEKAWPEMIHRYLAGGFGLCVIAFSLYTLSQKTYTRTAKTLICLIIFQALLGLWTVTLKLHPVTVMLHLLGGFTTAVLLFSMLLRKKESTQLDRIGYFIFSCIILQILLGGWVSSNYAALICPDFPYCQGFIFPEMSFKSAFTPWLPMGDNYQYGVMDNTARVTIHLTHRYFAVILSIGIIGFLSYCYLKKQAPTKYLIATMGVLITQVTLGILNITLLLPMHVALSHNFFGLLLLLSWLSLLRNLKQPLQIT